MEESFQNEVIPIRNVVEQDKILSKKKYFMINDRASAKFKETEEETELKRQKAKALKVAMAGQYFSFQHLLKLDQKRFGISI